MNPVVSLWICWLFNSTWPITGHVAVLKMSPVLLAWFAAFAGFCVFIPRVYKTGAWRKLLRADVFWKMVYVGAFGSAIPIIFFFSALKYTTPANAAILAQIEVVYSFLIAYLLLSEKISGSQIAGSLLVVSGTCLIAFNERLSPRWRGDLMILATPWMYQLSHAFVKKLPDDCPEFLIAFGRLFFGWIILTPIVAAYALFGNLYFEPGIKAFSVILYHGIILSAFSIFLWYNTIRRMDLAKATAVLLSYPVMTTLLSWLLLREKIFPYQIGGMVLAIAGAWWITLLSKQSSRGIIKDSLSQV